MNVITWTIQDRWRRNRPRIVHKGPGPLPGTAPWAQCGLQLAGQDPRLHAAVLAAARAQGPRLAESAARLSVDELAAAA